MSMPLLISIEQTSKEFPCSWILKTSKKKTVYVRYINGKLSCRYDSEFTGKEFYSHRQLLRAPTSINTDQMLALTKFKLEHYLLPSNSNDQT